MRYEDFRPHQRQGKGRYRPSTSVSRFRPRQRRQRRGWFDAFGLLLIAVAVGAYGGLDWPQGEAAKARAELSGIDTSAPAFTISDPSRLRIVDGDTFWYGSDKFRIADIDTPEVHGACPYETQLAARATARMGTLLRAGPFQLRPIARDEDQYGRKLRVVTRNGLSVGDQLVAEGLARTWTGRRESWCI